jgi:hypothetical protein
MIKIGNVLMISILIGWISCQAYENYIYPIEEDKVELSNVGIERVVNYMKKVQKDKDNDDIEECYNLLDQLD